MDDNTQVQLNLKLMYRSLPEKIKDVIVATETTDTYNEIEKEFQLNKTQRETLSVQTGFLLLGLRDPEELVTALASALEIDREKASLIAKELNSKIFSLIKSELKELFQKNHSIVSPFQTQSIPTTNTVPQHTGTSAIYHAGVPHKPESPTTQLPIHNTSAPISEKSQNDSVPQTQRVVIPPKSEMTGATPKTTTPSVQNIFEQKLGGAFRVKSDAVEYSAPSMPTPLRNAEIPQLSQTQPFTSPQPQPVTRIAPPSPLRNIPGLVEAPKPPQPSGVPPLTSPTQKSPDPYRELPV